MTRVESIAKSGAAGVFASSWRRYQAEQWLRKHVRKEALFRVLEGLLNIFAGLVALALTSFFTAVIPCFILLRFVGSQDLLQFETMAILVSGLLLVAFLGAYRESRTSASPHERFGWRSPGLGGGKLGAVGSFWSDCLFSGPRLFLMAGDTFWKAGRLLRLDIPQVTLIVAWLFRKSTKASVAEISSVFPGLNVVRILPQLRDVPGVVWLPNANGIILLMEEFRRSFAAAAGLDPRRAPRPNQPGEPEPEPHAFAPERDPVENYAMLSWYATLGLPAFAPLQTVKRRYRQLVKIHHPDARGKRRGNVREETGEPIIRINEAYHCILKYSKDHPELGG